MLLPKKIVDAINKEIKSQQAIIKNLKEHEANYNVNHQETIVEIQKSVEFMVNVLTQAK